MPAVLVTRTTYYAEFAITALAMEMTIASAHCIYVARSTPPTAGTRRCLKHDATYTTQQGH